MFDKNSIVVSTWVRAVMKGEKGIEEVPNLLNLIEIVTEIVQGGENNV